MYWFCMVRLSNSELHNTDLRTLCVRAWWYAHHTLISSDVPWSPVPPPPQRSFVSVSEADSHESSWFQSFLDSCLTPQVQIEILKTKSQDWGSEGHTQVQDRVNSLVERTKQAESSLCYGPYKLLVLAFIVPVLGNWGCFWCVLWKTGCWNGPRWVQGPDLWLVPGSHWGAEGMKQIMKGVLLLSQLCAIAKT